MQLTALSDGRGWRRFCSGFCPCAAPSLGAGLFSAGQFMRDLLSWSVGLGRWAGVQVRLHVFFLLLVVYVLHLAALQEGARIAAANSPALLWYGVALIAVLLASVLWHEAAHCVAAQRVGGAADQVLLWPLGGLAPASVPPDPLSELSTTLAGPAANLLVCCACAPALHMLGGNVLDFLNPFVPPAAPASNAPADWWGLGLALTFWVNWVLVIVNLLPAYPLDGARALRAAIWYFFGFRLAAAAAARGGQAAAVGVWIAAILIHPEYPFATMPLVIVGMFLFFAAKSELDRAHDQPPEEWMFGYDFSQGYTSLERAHEPAAGRERTGPLRQWIEARREARRQRMQQQEAADERRVDDILARVHECGIEGLSPEEQALLKRVSARYRSRLGL